jgi:hypothetical protein
MWRGQITQVGDDGARKGERSVQILGVFSANLTSFHKELVVSNLHRYVTREQVLILPTR